MNKIYANKNTDIFACMYRSKNIIFGSFNQK